MATVQFAVLPSFAQLVLPDSSPVEDAVSYILLTLRKPAAGSALATNGEAACRSYAQAIRAQTGVESIGELRALTDADFRALDIPAMLRIYLKHLVRGTQSGRVVTKGGAAANGAAAAVTASGANGAAAAIDPFLQGLQNDFNYGEPFDMSLYSSSLAQLALMGFGAGPGLEALLMVDNRSVEAALELLLVTSGSDEESRKEKRAKVVEKLGRQATQARSGAAASEAAQALSRSQHEIQQDPQAVANAAAAAAQAASAAQVASDANAAAMLSLQSDLAHCRASLAREKSHRNTQAGRYASFITASLPLKLYTEFLKASLVKEYLLPVEMEQLEGFRTKHSDVIDEATAVGVIKSLGIEDGIPGLQALVRKVDRNKGGGPGGAAIGGNQQQPGDMDCVVCLDKPKNHIIMNCMHLCLCEDCANSWIQNKGAASTPTNCPICSKKITQIAKIYV